MLTGVPKTQVKYSNVIKCLNNNPRKDNICIQSCVINALNTSSFGLKFLLLASLTGERTLRREWCLLCMHAYCTPSWLLQGANLKSKHQRKK